MLECISFGMDVSNDGISKLCPYLKGNTSLREINLQYNDNLTNDVVPVLKEIILNSLIKVVDVNRTSITELKALNIVRARNQLLDGATLIDLTNQ